MIAAGGVSGGFSSAIAGGKFIDGFKQGVLTAGLNHAISHVVAEVQERQALNDILIEAGIDPNAIPKMTVETLYELVQKVAIFQDMYTEAGCPVMETGEYASENPYEVAYGRNNTKSYYTDSNKDVMVRTEVKSITFFKAAFSSYLRLASTMGHEFTHAIDHRNGNLIEFYNKFGKDMYKAKLEQRAIEWQIKYQAPYSQDNYNNYNDILNGN